MQYREKYYVSDTGLVKNIITGKILKLRKNPNGYLKANLSIHGKLSTIFIHTAVAELYIPNPENLPVVNHIDGNKQNNNKLNLEWCTYKYNSAHAHNLGLMNIPKGTQCYQSKLTRNDVIYLKTTYSNYPNLKRGTITKLAKQFNVSTGTIRNVLTGKTYRNIL